MASVGLNRTNLDKVKELVMRYLLLFSVLIAGCGGKESNKATDGSANSSAARSDDREEKYKASVIAFIEESKNTLKLMDRSPDKAAFDKRYKALDEQFSKLPDPTSGFAPSESWTKSNKAILVNLTHAGSMLGNEAERNKLGELKSALAVLLDYYETKVRSSQSYALPTLVK